MSSRAVQPAASKADSPSLSDYVRLIRAFVEGQLDVSDFATRYLRLFLSDETFRPETIYQALNSLFLDVDAFYPDAEIRGPDGIDEEELRRRAAATLDALSRA
jgi:hypothetical protein